MFLAIFYLGAIFGVPMGIGAFLHNDAQKKQRHRPNYWEILPQGDPPVTAPFYESGGRYG